MKRLAITTILACILASASLAGAQTLQTLYAFVSPNGCNPQTPLTVGPDGNFYGTTTIGGTNGGSGTIFKVTTNGVLTSLFQFSVTNGSIPAAALTLANDGCLYGTTEYGGSYGDGTIFKITTGGTFTLLDSFNATNGAYPTTSLTLAPNGSLYGTTVYGGAGYGVVFNVTTNGVLTKLASFTSAYQSSSGTQNKSALIFGTDGALYGTTAYGGTAGEGQVFRVTTTGTLSIFVSQLNFFSEGNANAPGLTLGKDGNFYGILCYGGAGGYGSIYKITSVGTLSTIYTFPWASSGYYYINGCNPLGSLIAGKDGYLYGTAKYGGTNGPNAGYGTIFKVSTSGALTSLASFASTNGAYPCAGLTIGNDGNFYGTTYGGGDGGQGAVFELSTNGPLTELAAFPGSIGCWPKSALTIGSDGNFYGTTSGGGTNGGFGTCFQFTTNGLFTSLVSLSNGLPESDLTLASDGSFYSMLNNGTVFNLTTNGQIASLANLNNGPPYSSLKPGADGAFYGESYGGNGSGVLFRVLTNGLVTNLVSFAGTNGSDPQGGLCLGNDGNFYGVTSEGGNNNADLSDEGTVFELTTNNLLKTLKTFLGNNNGGYYYGDGALPNAGLCLASDGALYGTTASGGSITTSQFPFGCGEVFKVATNGVVSSVASFNGTSGAQPAACLAAGSDGNLYGTTIFGGTGNPKSVGNIFRVKPKGGITALISFNGANGSYLPTVGTVSTWPQAGLTIGRDGNLYGTTSYGGAGGNGTIFRVLLPPDLAVPPQSLTNIAGSTATFTVSATSLQPLTYQWQKNYANLMDGGNVSGSATSNLVVTGLSEGDAGIYSVIVSNANFGVTNVVTLTVIDPPVIAVQPISQRVLAGEPVSFSITVSNPPPVSYQWDFNAVGILHATNAVLTIPAAALTNAGIYSVVVTNLAGSLTSSNATLAVIVPPTMGLQLSAGYPVLSLGGMLSNNFMVQYNTDLIGTNWITLLSLTNLLTSPYLFIDPAGIVPPARFYRAVMQ